MKLGTLALSTPKVMALGMVRLCQYLQRPGDLTLFLTLDFEALRWAPSQCRPQSLAKGYSPPTGSLVDTKRRTLHDPVPDGVSLPSAHPPLPLNQLTERLSLSGAFTSERPASHSEASEDAP